jgi:hypothetical protein
MTIPNNFIVQSQITGGNTSSAPRCWSLTTADLQATVFAPGYLNDYAGNFKANDVAFLTYGYGDATQASAQCYIADVDGNLSFVVGILGASGPLSFKGTWNASTNTPMLPQTPALDMLGDFYIVNVAGTFETIAYGIGDWIVAGPTAWTRVANGATGLALTDGHIFVGNATNAATDVAVSGDLTLVNTGAFTIANGAITDAKVGAAAGIALSKLAALGNSFAVATNGSGQLTVSAVTAAELGYVSGVTSAIQTQLDAKLSASLASSKVLVGNGAGVATAVAMSGSISMDNTGATTIANGVIVDAMINASANISLSKLVALTPSKALISNIGGFLSTSNTTDVELGYLSGVTSSVQSQIGSKAPLASPTFTGTVTMGTKLDAATGANASVGEFTLDGVTPVLVANTSITASSLVFISKVSNAGTPGTVPTYTLSAGVGFTVVGAALDTSVYNYLIIN